MSDVPTRHVLTADLDALLYAEVERLRATNAELVAVLDAARLVLKGRDQREDEMRVYNAIRMALAKAGGKDAA